nr:DNA-directed RNA polymerase I subunit RPA2 [Seculamonas ecuadoriensis]
MSAHPKKHIWSESLPSDACAKLQALVRPHIDAFNYFVEPGIALATASLEPVEIVDAASGRVMKVSFTDVSLRGPAAGVTPALCRERSETYKGDLFGTLVVECDGQTTTLPRKLGSVPIMVKSSVCNIRDYTPKQLVEAHEEAMELGGYFIQNGIERCIRMLVIARRNFPLAIDRTSFAKRGPKFSSFGVMMRCVRPDQSAVNNLLHYLTDGEVLLAFTMAKQQFYLPVTLILKALKETTDREVYDRVLQGDFENTFVTERVEAILREFHDNYSECVSQEKALEYIGSRFRVRMSAADRMTDREVGEKLIREYVLVHLPDNNDKFNMLILILQKLYALVKGDITSDSPDSPIFQEILMGPHVYLMLLKDKLQDYLGTLKAIAIKESRSDKFRGFNDAFLKKLFEKNPIDIGRKLEYFLATGNLVTTRALGLGQTSGFTILAEKLNFFRFISHFRSVHRGAAFQEMRTTSVRKLVPDAWGFFCPVHTPDGAPCGLLNHLAAPCEIVSTAPSVTVVAHLISTLILLGMHTSIHASAHHAPDSTQQHASDETGGLLSVVLDGRVIGGVGMGRVYPMLTELHCMKARGELPHHLELALIPPARYGPFPGLYLFSSIARMMRPVQNLLVGKQEYVGSLEQAFMNIAAREDEIQPGYTTHLELSPMNILSVVASLTPFSDFNQSPRNMYQCQMAKQSMATPHLNVPHRIDNKTFRLMHPQTPLCRNDNYDAYEVDNYPIGANAVVAVISYTGYDMEDAMIINKSAYERGFGHGVVYLTEIVELEETRGKSTSVLRFSNRKEDSRTYVKKSKKKRTTLESGEEVETEEEEDPRVNAYLDIDGLPRVGTLITKGDPFYCLLDESTGQHRVVYYKKSEPARIQDVKLIGRADDGRDTNAVPIRATIKLRVDRNPVIGDKFASRHGQKGTLSFLWPQESMPFSESGMTPDIIINPHAFPSRMTIGMLIESSASKAGALHGVYQNSTPFRFSEDQRAIDYFGEQLLKAGYNYHGNETLYSGTLGVEMQADIYFGVVYYQRLRHMVKDKFQVRSTGPVHNLTQQPVKGRKLGGGIRFGEMERDSLLAHGVSFFLNDRLFHSSDESKCLACKHCGSIISVITDRSSLVLSQRRVSCLSCKSSEHIVQVSVPFVFRFLVNELTAMNIRLNLGFAQSSAAASVSEQ